MVSRLICWTAKQEVLVAPIFVIPVAILATLPSYRTTMEELALSPLMGESGPFWETLAAEYPALGWSF